MLPLWGRLPEPQGVLAAFAQLAEEWRHRPAHFRLRTQALLAEMLVAAARDGVPRGDAGAPLRTEATAKAEVLGRLLRYLDQHCTEPFRAEDVQRELGYSYAHLCRLFRQASGTTIRAYVRRRRVERACDLLLDPYRQCSMADVGRLVGYDDPCYFSRVFRQATGLSPRRYVARAYADTQRSGCTS